MTELQSTHRLDRLSRIAHARQAVMQGGPNAAAQYVQPWIAQSWQRCLQAGHRPEDRLGFDMVTNATQRRSLEANHVLRQAARSTLDQLSIAIAQTRYFAILTSASGEVIDTGGAIDRSDRRADLITRVGVDLSELAVGTTAIGLTLQEQRSTWLHRGEHFYQDTQWYSCAGAPITGPDGRCVGMVDVTGIEVAERPALAHLVATSARAIENALVLSRPHTLVLHLQWPGQHCGKDSEGLVCVDADGVIGAMNPMARQMLGLLQPAPASLHLSDVFAISCGSIFDAQHSAGWMTVPLWSGLHLEARTSSAGTLAPKSRGSATPLVLSSPVQALKEHENALIKQTVTKLRGNVAAAAEQLGISRSTIYRKLGKPRR